MHELFGIPLGTLLLVLLVLLGLSLGAVLALAARSPVLLKLGLRNVGRRGGRTALIVLGLMLGTTIIAAALTTGDTMSHTIRSTAVAALGTTDEVVSAKGAIADIPGELGEATGTGYFDESVLARVDEAVAGSPLVDGVAPAIVEQVALQAPAQRQNEPRVTLFATDPARAQALAPMRADGEPVSLSSLVPGEGYVNADAAAELGVAAGDSVLVYAGGEPALVRVRDVVEFDGTGTDSAALLLPLRAAQELLGRERLIKHVLVSNRGGPTEGAALSDEVVALLEPALSPLGLEVETAKRDAIEAADEAGSAFMAFFTTFGSFSIAAGILLIFLIFVMLAAERRGELGISRAIGTRRGHLVQLFLFEGAAYDVAAAAVGALLGAVVAFGMVVVMASAFGADPNADLQIQYAVTPRSLLVAFALGVLLTLVVVAVSAWRVSVMTISSAIRNLPEPPRHGQRTRWLVGGGGVVLGGLLALSGWSGAAATPLMLGISLVLVSLVPIVRVLGVPERPAYTAAGLAVVVILMLPWSVWEAVFGELSMDFSTWIMAGLMIVIGAVWTIIFNADVLLGAAMASLGRVRRVAPVLRVAMAYPLASRFRTGTTLAMFTLVVFTLVTGTATPASFVRAFANTDAYGGGFDVRAATSATAPVDDMRGALAAARGVDATDYAAVSSQSVLGVEARQLTAGRPHESYAVRGLDRAFLEHTTFELGALARGYGTSAEVWQALRDRPGLAVVDAIVVQRRDQFGFNAAPPDFKLTGLYYEDGLFDAIPVEVRDPQTGRTLRLTVIGVLSDTAPLEMMGLSASQETLEAAFPGRVHPTIHYFALTAGVEAGAAARSLEAAFVANGMEADSIEQVVADASAASMTFNRLIQGFMGLGLVVGVAALGVISARAVVERRQQIGVLRALGFRRRMVEAIFLLESSFVALTAIVVGTGLGLLLAWEIVRDTRQQASWQGLELVVPWTNLGLIYLVVYAVAMAATLAPALRAARTVPAEALRYQ